MYVWRLENEDSKKGPFEHSDEQHAVKKIKDMPDVMPFHCESNFYTAYPDAVWGWSDVMAMFRMLKDPVALDELGFRVCCYSAGVLYMSTVDDQVVFALSSSILRSTNTCVGFVDFINTVYNRSLFKSEKNEKY